MMPRRSYEQRFSYHGEAAGPPEVGGHWRFFTPADVPEREQGGAQTITLTDHQHAELGRPSVIVVTIARADFCSSLTGRER